MSFHAFPKSLLLVAVLACTGAAFGTVPGVVINVPGDFATIQEAIDAAAVSGDEIIVDPGTYAEVIDFTGKAIYLHSAHPNPAKTIIDGTGLNDSVVLCISGEGAGTILEGFTLTGGDAFIGGGMFNDGSSPTVTNCTFRGNTATSVAGAGGNGGGMYNLSSSPIVTNCTFSGNTATTSGGGMYNFSSSPIVTNCTFSGNTSNADGGGMRNTTSSNPTLTNCTFNGNTALGGAGGGGISNFFGSSPTLTNGILWADSPNEVVNQGTSTIVVLFSDIQGGLPAGAVDGGGNINADPLFVDADGVDNISGTTDDNLHLNAFSPCIDAGDNSAPGLVGITTGLDGAPRFFDDLSVPDTGSGLSPIVDMGAYEDQPRQVTYNIAGTATIIDAGNLIGGSTLPAMSVPFQGSFSFDADAQLINPGTTTASYRMSPPLPPNELSILVRGVVIEADPSQQLDLTVQNLTPAPPPTNSTDSFHLRSNYPKTSGVALVPHPASSIDLVFLDSTGVVFSDKSIPTAFDFPDFNLIQILVQFRDPNAIGTVLYQVNCTLNSVVVSGDTVAPTANAGPDQPIHAGELVNLDGSGSFDDTTATLDLQFAWSFSAKPAGSVATLSGANTVTPSFVADLPGEFRLDLVVTDEAALTSAPDEVVISSMNIAPTADAGSDQIVVVGSSALLDGSASTDPEEDPLSFSWTVLAAPAGSVAVLMNAGSATPTLVPDLTGEYIIQLVVDDGFEPSDPDQLTVTAITGAELAELLLQDACDFLGGLPDSSFDAKGHRRSMCNAITKIIKDIQNGKLDQARNKLEREIERTDGCALRTTPDPKGGGQTHAADFLVLCVDQAFLYGLMDDALNALAL